MTLLAICDNLFQELSKAVQRQNNFSSRFLIQQQSKKKVRPAPYLRHGLLIRFIDVCFNI